VGRLPVGLLRLPDLLELRLQTLTGVCGLCFAWDFYQSIGVNMKTTVNVYDFHREFELIRPNNFSRAGLNVLFDYFDEYEQESGEQMELDVIAICCDFTEATWQEIAENYSIDLTDAELGGEKYEIVKTYLEDQGALIGEVDGGFVYRNDF
jgi:hypothetical protein